MKIGYARVSTTAQNLDMQIEALNKAGCEKIYTEKESGVKERPVLKEMLSFIRQGDTLVVYKLDRLGRSVRELLAMVGIPEEAIGLIFERFYRVDKARSRKAGGAGLGLSIVRDMVLRNDGSISVSDRPGGGSRFRLSFPYYPMPEEDVT